MIEELSDAPWFDLRDTTLECKVVDVYDGDTVTLIFPFSDTFFKGKCRLLEVDTAEIRSKNQEEKKAAIEARDWLKNRILGKVVQVYFYKRGPYSRFLVKLYEGDSYINEEIIQKGLGYRYDGKKKRKKWGDWEYSPKII